MFYAWKQYQQDKMDRYLFKTNAIEKIWFLMNRGAKKEMKRAMTIWKLRKQFNIHKTNKLRAAILNMQKDKCKKAFNRW
jgi:outer membrane receptor for ferrienterochelin and colicin